MLYIASAQPLPEIPWDPNKPAFHVTRVDSMAEGVDGKFSMPFVYRAGSDEGCACDFEWAASNTGDLPEHMREDNEHYRPRVKRLRSYLDDAAKRSDLEMYFCWDEDQVLSPLAEPMQMPALSLKGPFPPSHIPERILLRIAR